MTDLDFVLSLAGFGGIPLIIPVLNYFKRWVSDTRWYVPIAVGIGLALNAGLHFGLLAKAGHPLFVSIVIGIAAGLSAAGLYSGYSTVKEGPTADKKKREKK